MTERLTKNHFEGRWLDWAQGDQEQVWELRGVVCVCVCVQVREKVLCRKVYPFVEISGVQKRFEL